MKKILCLIILSIKIVQAGNPIKEVNEKAVTELINTILSKKQITDRWEERLFQAVSSFDHRIPFMYKNISYDASPLFAALLTKNHALLQKILMHGASVDYPEKDSATPLMQAAYLGDEKAFKILLRAGANAKITDNYKCNTLNYALSCSLKSQNPVLRYFKDPDSFLDNGPEEPGQAFTQLDVTRFSYNNPLFDLNDSDDSDITHF